MKYFRKYIIIAILIILGLSIFFHGLRQYLIQSAHDYEDPVDLTTLYTADNEIDTAKNRLIEIRNNKENPSEVIIGNDNPQQIAIIFEGLPDRITTSEIVDILKKHNVPATFFVEGQDAGDFPETIKLLDGYDIGNTTYVGLTHLEKLSEEEQLKQIVRAQKILNTCFTAPVNYFHGITTKYSQQLLEVTKSANIPYAVKENYRYQFHLMKNDNHNIDVSQLHGIISFPIGKVVDTITYKPGDINERPEMDKKPTLKLEEKKSNRLTTAEELDVFLTACKNAHKQIVPLSEMKTIKFISGTNIETEENK